MFTKQKSTGKYLKETPVKQDIQKEKKGNKLWLPIGLTGLSYFLTECLMAALMGARDWAVFGFGLLWAVLLTAIVWMLPKIAARIVYGVSYFAVFAWAMAQTGYYRLFRKLMWFTDIVYAGEGADYLGDVLSAFPLLWWLGGIVLIGLGVTVILLIPKRKRGIGNYIACGVTAAVMIAGLFGLPELVFLRDNDIWGTHSEYAQSSSYEATYRTMYDAKNVYNICGIYQLSFRDLWKHILYPLTPAYLQEQKNNTEEISAYFEARGEHQENEMTGALAGKNVILVLMESMDDWMITEDDTPTICRLMNEGINFTNFYTPGYGGARTINSEFCVNSGIYLPTNGKYVFNYVTNNFNQSIASQLVANGYSAEVFHYNDASFYSRGVFEPALGYNAYNSYADYTTDTNELYDDCYLFKNQDLNDLFFRDGQTFNFIITRSAHLSYAYNEVLSNYALKLYPEYRGKFGHQEIDCARVKAKLVDDMFARLLEELEAKGQLENTVIIGVTDHYTYGFKDTEKLLELSGIEDETRSLALEKTPCFIWTAEGPSMTVGKTLNTADLLPTVLNLMGIESPYDYLGQDAFDPNYEGYALFPNGNWISDGVICQYDSLGEAVIVANEKDLTLTQDYLQEMQMKTQDFIRISNLLLISDYYKAVPEDS